MNTRNETSSFRSWPEWPWNWPERYGSRNTSQFRLGLVALGALWLALACWRWALWGDLTVDCGREMYVPWAITQGKVLYRDIWYLYGPFGPYLNALLMKLFGPSLSVLYAAGLSALLAQVVVLYWLGTELCSPLAGFTVAAAVLFQSLENGIFNYALPYAYDSVYGSVFSSLMLLFVLRIARRNTTTGLTAAGVCAALAFVCKLEFGFACYVSLLLLLAARVIQHRLWRSLARDLLHLLPGIAICAATVGWMVSLRGASFITQENLSSWPTAYFMRIYGQYWLAHTGGTLDPRVVLSRTAYALVCLAAFVFAGRWVRSCAALPARAAWLRLALSLLALAALATLLAADPGDILRDRVFSVLLYAAYPLSVATFVLVAWPLLRKGIPAYPLVLLLAFALPLLLNVRVAFGTRPADYSIYFNGTLYLAMIVLLLNLVGAYTAALTAKVRNLLTALVLFPFAATIVYGALPSYALSDEPLPFFATSRGLLPAPPQKIAAYREAIAFMQQARARGEQTLSVPEDTSLYFLAGVLAPTRCFAFTPGILDPDRMTGEFFRQMETAKVKYVIWSNRQTIEYGAPRFGSDYNAPIGDYIRAHYHPIAHIGPGALDSERQERPQFYNPGVWHATIWERNPTR